MLAFRMNKIDVTAEIGCNHMGDFDIALQMINIASHQSMVGAVKFQKRTVSDLLGPTEYEAQHPHPEHSFGSTYGRHRDFLEFDIERHAKLKAACESAGTRYSCSVWDLGDVT